jgi:hypothetical protein
MDKPFQRKGAESNTQLGRDFEVKAQNFFAQRGLHLTAGMSLEIGINSRKFHNFDIGDEQKKVVVECKAHTWTEGGNVPSAKMTTWNQAMFFFYDGTTRLPEDSFCSQGFQSKKKRNPRRILHSNESSPHPERCRGVGI